MSHLPPRRSNVRVLIIEDHTLFAESLELALSMEGYDVRRPVAPPSATARRPPCCRPPSSSIRASCCSTSTSGGWVTAYA